MTRAPRLAIEGGLVVAFDGVRHGLMPGATVVCDGDTIAYVGYGDTAAVDRRVGAAGRLVIPGLINLEACTYIDVQGFATDRAFPNYFGPSGFNFAPRHDQLDVRTTPVGDDEARASALYGLAQAVQGGATTVVGTDYGNVNPEYGPMLVEAAERIGVRAYFAKAFGAARHYVTPEGGQAFHWDEPGGAQGLRRSIEYAEWLRMRRAQPGAGDVHGMLFPYRFDAMTEGLLQECRAEATRRGIPIRMHAAQFLPEYYEQVRRTSESPLECLDRLRFLEPDVLIHHAIFTTEHSWIPRTDGRDLAILAASGASIGHCPTIFARRSVVLESFSRYRRAGINLGLGTDTVPQDMLMVMRWAATMCKIADRNTNTGTAAEVFDAATLGGARALARPDLGRIAPGAKADFLIVRIDGLRAGPIEDPLRNLVHLCTSADIESVWVGGRRVVEHGVVTGADEAAIMPHMRRAMERQRAHFLEIGRTPAHAGGPFGPSLPVWDKGTKELRRG